MSRSLNPLLASYALEAGVGVFVIIFGFIRFFKLKQTIPILPKKEFIKIVLISATTISGTIFYGLALNRGPYALIASLMTVTGVITFIIGYFLFKEKLTKQQTILTILILSCVAMLKLLS